MPGLAVWPVRIAGWRGGDGGGDMGQHGGCGEGLANRAIKEASPDTLPSALFCGGVAGWALLTCILSFGSAVQSCPGCTKYLV